MRLVNYTQAPHSLFPFHRRRWHVCVLRSGFLLGLPQQPGFCHSAMRNRRCEWEKSPTPEFACQWWWFCLASWALCKWQITDSHSGGGCETIRLCRGLLAVDDLLLGEPLVCIDLSIEWFVEFVRGTSVSECIRCVGIVCHHKIALSHVRKKLTVTAYTRCSMHHRELNESQFERNAWLLCTFHVNAMMLGISCRNHHLCAYANKKRKLSNRLNRDISPNETDDLLPINSVNWTTFCEWRRSCQPRVCVSYLKCHISVFQRQCVYKLVGDLFWTHCRAIDTN